MLRTADIAGEDAFAVGARITVPLHGRAASEALAAMDTERMHLSEIATGIPTLDDVYLNRTGAEFVGVN